MRQTVLHQSVINRAPLDLLRILIKGYADVNARDLHGRTPLFYACINNDIESAAFLLANMSTAFAIDYEGYTIEDATESFVIADMIKKGKMVNPLIIESI